MATESDLRDLLRDPDPEGRAAIDLDAVLTRARRRRRPKVIAAQALGSVAVIGALFTAVVAVQPTQQAALMTAEDAAGGSAADSAPFVDQDALKSGAPECGAPVAVAAPSPDLALEISLPTVFEPETRIPLTVTLRNEGTAPIQGSTASAPTMTFTRDRIVIWHSFAVQDLSARIVDLAPGESVTYETYFDRVVCGSEDDLVMDDPANPLPTADPGQYELFATLSISTDDGPVILASASPLPIEIVG
ncbi:hypothetical protein [Pseudolysinimonas sp.]|uniref:hypothetical protein n=1 Tax=Pseudolysinimonas sp. TaxID=2680009 RepID=UPI003783C743